jgi:hypothetical protein
MARAYLTKSSHSLDNTGAYQNVIFDSYLKHITISTVVVGVKSYAKSIVETQKYASIASFNIVIILVLAGIATVLEVFA